MSTHTSIHYAHEIRAIAGGTLNSPLRIQASHKGSTLPDEVTFFTDDFELSRKLADAINETVREHNAALAAKSAKDAAEDAAKAALSWEPAQ